MCLPMAPRFLLVWLSLASVALAAQDPAVGPAPKPMVTIRTVITQLDPKTGKPETLSIPTVTTASGLEARVAVGGKPDFKGKVENTLEMTLSPTVQADGTVSVSLRVTINNKPDPSLEPKTEKQRRRESKAHDGNLIFYSVLAKEGLFSVQDGKGNRRWYKINGTVDGWTLESYDDEKQMLIVGQGSTHQELHLYKTTIEASANEISTVVTLRSGETVKVPGVGGLELSVSAVVTQPPVAPLTLR